MLHNSRIWRTKNRTFDLTKRGLVMGVLNVTEDSFSDGGRFIDLETAVAHGVAMETEGAEIIDVGGESTRPGAKSVPVETERARVLPVIERLASLLKRAVISIDTCKPDVARAAIECGAGIINDVTGLRDSQMRDVVRETGAGAIAMHMQGTPRDMQNAPRYDDVVVEIREFFRQTFDQGIASSVDPMYLAFDPGIGFGKTVNHNLMLLKNLDRLRVSDRPLVLGVSRKSFLGKVCGSTEMADRFWPTVALTSFCREHDADIVRVHDVKPNVEAMRMTEAILG
jgi:dihydropteroate synthase